MIQFFCLVVLLLHAFSPDSQFIETKASCYDSEGNPLVSNQLSIRLLTAARQEDTRRLAWLLECGADPNAQDNFGQTSLQIAINSQNHEIAQLLVEYGADVNREDNWGQTIEQYLAILSHLDAYDSFFTILKNNAKASFGTTVLAGGLATAFLITLERPSKRHPQKLHRLFEIIERKWLMQEKTKGT